MNTIFIRKGNTSTRPKSVCMTIKSNVSRQVNLNWKNGHHIMQNITIINKNKPTEIHKVTRYFPSKNTTIYSKTKPYMGNGFMNSSTVDWTVYN